MTRAGAMAQVQSRYEEDVYPGNHTSVWGSFWADGELRLSRRAGCPVALAFG